MSGAGGGANGGSGGGKESTFGVNEDSEVFISSIILVKEFCN